MSILVDLLKGLLGSRKVLREPQAGDSCVIEGDCSEQGQHAEAEVEASLRETIRREPDSAEAHSNLGVVLIDQGRMGEAELSFRAAIRLKPSSAESYSNLGVVLINQRRLDEAEASFRQAILLKPDCAEAHSNLGFVLIDQRRLAEAEASCREALRFKPDYPESHSNLGNVLRDQGRLVEAEASCREALRLNSNYAEAHGNLGVVLKDQGRLAEAEISCREALRLRPWFAEAHSNLGAVMLAQGRIEEAGASFCEAIRLKPDYAEAHSNLGNVFRDQRRLAEAEASYREAIRLKPDYAGGHSNLGVVFKDQRRLTEAEASFREAIRLKPDYAEAHNNLGNVLQHQGRLGEAEASFREAIRLDPEFAVAYSNLLFSLLYSSHDPEHIWLEYRNFAEKFEAPLKANWPCHPNLPDPNRRLKIGYVSGDFRRNHPVAFFIEPILANRNKESFEIFAYNNHLIQDVVTKRIAANVDNWFDCVGVEDVALARRIQDDGVDILVDLSGHTAHNRLLVFARKPAPVQVTWIGCPGTTGLDAMDYRFTSESLDPPGLTEKYHSEQLFRLPESATYQPLAEAPEINNLPALESDRFVLACLNNPTKINSEVIDLWAVILNRIPQAQLMFGNATDSAIRDWLVGEFARRGIGDKRLILHPRLPMNEYLALHHQIDLALDPFPYNGGITTMHALWMGVPVVTLSGSTTQSRVGVSVLRQVGLESFIAHSKEEYLERVLYWSQHLLPLSQIRHSLRDQIKSVEKQPDEIVTHVENAYRWMWSRWCEKQK